MKKYVIVDIDGTVSKVGDRLKYLKTDPPDWDSFYEACDEDKPFVQMLEMVSVLSRAYFIIFCTGRRESVREKTLYWLLHNYDRPPISYKLLMQKDGDRRHDTIAKPELLSDAGIPTYDIAFVIEDRNSMVAKWRELGLLCLQPFDGDF